MGTLQRFPSSPVKMVGIYNDFVTRNMTLVYLSASDPFAGLVSFCLQGYVVYLSTCIQG